MEKIEDLKKKKLLKKGRFEYCVLCGKRTDVKRSEPVENRKGYVEGVGQLCESCFYQLY